ncbi:unnamed protein product [Mortierella alpina]
MRHWSDFLDLNLLRPSAFERRHIEVQRHQQAHQRHSSTSSLPHNLPSRFASFTVPVSYNLDPASPLNASLLHPRQSLDGRRRHVSVAGLSQQQQLQVQQQPSSQTHHTSFFSTRFLTPPASSSSPSGDGSTPSRFTLTGARGRRSRGTSVDAAANTASTGEEGSSSSSRRSFLRPFFNRNSSWNGPSPSSATPSSISTITQTHSNASRTTTTTGHNGVGGGGGGGRLDDDGHESEEERQRQQRPTKFLARPTTGIDMTPRTDRMRRRTHVDDEDLVGTAGAAGTAAEAAAAEGATEVIVSAPLTIADTAAETVPTDEASEGTLATEAATGAATAGAAAARDQAESIQAATAATLGHSISRTSTASPASGTASTRAPTTSVLQRPSLNESRTLTIQDPNGLILQRQPTPAEQNIQRQLNYLKKFMWVIATMPIIATLAIHNRLELVMWWVLVVPLVGIAFALLCRRRLAGRLQRLQEQTDLARLSLAFAPTQSSTARVPRHQPETDDEPPPPPDYQSSIITPPAYIVAQQPRKVPSYRSLENLFAFARNGSRIFSRGTAGAAANTTTASVTGDEEGEGESGERQQEEGEANRGDPPVVESVHQEDSSRNLINNDNNDNRSAIVQMPEDSAEAPQASEQTLQHSLEHKTEEPMMPQEIADDTFTTTTTSTTITTTPMTTTASLTTITVVPRVEIEFVQPQAYLPQTMPEMVEVGAGLRSHPPPSPSDQHHLHQYQGTRSFVSTTSSSGGSTSTAHETMHDLTLVDSSFDDEWLTDRRPSLSTVISLDGDWATDQDSHSAESSSLAHARHRSRDIKGKAPSRE